MRVFELDGARRPDVELPGKGSVGGFRVGVKDDETFYSYTDFTTPPSVYRYDIETGRSEAVSEPVVSVDTSRFTSRQVFATSADGTRVPMFVVHRDDSTAGRRRRPCSMATAVSTFRSCRAYSSMRMAWLDAGGVYVRANLRGGGEYGEDWYRAGTVLNKQNVFDDFIAAAEWLIDNGVTDPDRLAIWGVSNGGLLAAATGLQRPNCSPR